MIINLDNVQLWFAKDIDGNIVTIGDIDETKKDNKYVCPLCLSQVIPKAIKSKQVTSHFAHVDFSKCNAETRIHWWFKNKFLEQGYNFVVVSDKERQYVCKEVLVEQSYNAAERVYNPDVTVITECGKTIFFEMDYSNKKKIQDYIDIWIELKNIVVEIDIKKLLLMDEVPSFKALFYDGKCFNTKKNDLYYNTIGRYKEENSQNINKDNRTKIKQLDWLWSDFVKYRNGEVGTEEIIELIKLLDIPEQKIVLNILKRTKCTDLHIWLKERIKQLELWYYKDGLPPEKVNLIRKAIRQLNKEYKKIDNNYDISVSKESNKYKSHYWFRGRKIGCWLTDSYSYRFQLSYNGSIIIHEYIKGIILDINSLERIRSYFEELIKNHKITTNCLDCKSRFEITSREIKYYGDNNLKLPKRCKSCRELRKANKTI